MSATVLTDMQSQREQAYKSYQEGNYKDAYDGYRKLALDPNDDPRLAGDDLSMATSCLQPLNRADELDDFREAVVEVHKNNWRLLQAAAANYLNDPHYGFMVAGKFYRGNKRGGGNWVNTNDRDRIRALQLMVQAMPLAQKDDNHREVGAFFLSLADMLLANRRGRRGLATAISQRSKDLARLRTRLGQLSRNARRTRRCRRQTGLSYDSQKF